jgi:hypothetical protein
MGKGSKQRPTAKEFWDNWDAVFGDKEEKNYEYNWEPYGDQTVPRPVANLTCEHCGDEVEHVF